jgi:hypothetical protein
MKVECFCYFFGAFSPKNYIYVKTIMTSNIKKKGVPKHLIPNNKVEDIYKLEMDFIQKQGEIERNKILIKENNKMAAQQIKKEGYEFVKLTSKGHDVSIDVVSKELTNVDTK